MELELAGPRVSVDRDGSGDRGGGQLVLKAGTLLVRARSVERVLGPADAIEHVQLVDLARLQAKVSFVGGAIWNVYSEQGEALTAFFKQVATAAGRSELLREPPRVSELARAWLTPERKRTGVIAAIAVLASIGGVYAYTEVSERMAREQAAERARAAATQRANEAAARAQADARERRARADALAPQLVEAMGLQRYRDAKALRDQITALVPEHPAAKQVDLALQPALAALDERERVTGITRAIATARVLAKDPVACETAKRVAEAYALVRRAQPADADYAAAQRAVETLERCRKRVSARYAQSAEQSRRTLRVMTASQLESVARGMGYPVRVTLEGRPENVLHIAARELDAGAAQGILAASARKDASFEATCTEQGFVRIELEGAGFKRAIALHPVPADALVVPVLEPLGLARPLALPATAP